MRRKMKAPPSSFTRPGNYKSRPIIIKDEADPILPKPMSEISRSEILPPYLFHKVDPLQNLLIN